MKTLASWIQIPMFAALVMIATANPTLASEWESLFDGKTIPGWTQRNGTASYRIEGDVIIGTTAEGSPNSFLCTDKLYGDFELEFEVKVDNRLNSGVQIRSQTKDGTKEGRVNGPQVEIEAGGADGAEAGYVYGEATGRGWLTPESRLKPHKHFQDGKWNKFRVVAKGPRIQTWINGQPIEDLTDEAIFKTHPKGFIGLQVHGIAKGSGPYEVAWRGLRIKVLD
jgi:3-keto-disaccharide hydrolase